MLNNLNISIDIDFMLSPKFIRFGDSVHILLRIHNSGSVNIVRDVDNNINISYHWYDKLGNIIEFEGIRTPLPKNILIGETIEADMLIKAPILLGVYDLYCTIVYESKFWLNDMNKESFNIKEFIIVNWTKYFTEKYAFSYPYSDKYNFRPLMIELENTNFCTNSCVICPNKNLTRKRQNMDMAIYRKILSDYDSIGGGELLIAPQIGDALCDNKLIEKLKIAKDINFTTSIYSNGMLINKLSDEDCKYLVSNIDYFYVSIYGINKNEYNIMTNRNTYDDLIKNIQRIARNNFIKQKMVLQFRFLKYHYKSEIEMWMYCNFGEIYNYSVCDQFANWAGGISAADVTALGGKMLPQPDYEGPCILPYLYHVVFVNGDVSFCPCADYNASPDFNLGNIINSSFSEILKNEKLEMYFNSLYMPEHCKCCSFYMSSTKMPSILKEYM